MQEENSALTLAAMHKQTEKLELLLGHPNIDVNLPNFGFTALMQAAFRGHTEIAEMLLAQPGIDANLQTEVEIYVLNILLRPNLIY